MRSKLIVTISVFMLIFPGCKAPDFRIDEQDLKEWQASARETPADELQSTGDFIFEGKFATNYDSFSKTTSVSAPKIVKFHGFGALNYELQASKGVGDWNVRAVLRTSVFGNPQVWNQVLDQEGSQFPVTYLPERTARAANSRGQPLFKEELHIQTSRTYLTALQGQEVTWRVYGRDGYLDMVFPSAYVSRFLDLLGKE